MTARFGRNKRRAAREALVAANQESYRRGRELYDAKLDVERYREAWERECGLLKHVSRECDTLKRTLERVQAMLAQYHPAAPRQTMVTDTPHEQTMLVPVMQRLEHMAPWDFSATTAIDIEKTVMRTVEAYALIAGTDEDVFRYCMHFNAQLGSGRDQIAYRLTKPAIAMIPSRYLIEDIAKELATGFVLALKSRKVGR